MGRPCSTHKQTTVHTDFIGKSEENRPLGRCRLNIKTCVMEIMDFIHQAGDRHRSSAHMITLMSLYNVFIRIYNDNTITYVIYIII
jgi:hypothetical protein